MALMPCPECKKRISTRAEACPHCGAPITAEQRAKGERLAPPNQRRTILACLGLVGIAIVGMWLTGPSSPPPASSQTGITVAPHCRQEKIDALDSLNQKSRGKAIAVSCNSDGSVSTINIKTSSGIIVRWFQGDGRLRLIELLNL